MLLKKCFAVKHCVAVKHALRMKNVIRNKISKISLQNDYELMLK